MSWSLLTIAGLLEVSWAIGLKYTEGFSRPIPTVLTVIAAIGSMVLLGLSVKDLPMGTAYAVWTGIGIVGTTVLGMVLFDETRDIVKVLCIMLILAGIVGLRLTSVET